MEQNHTITIPYSHFTPESFAHARSEFIAMHNEPVTHVHISLSVWNAVLISERFTQLIDPEYEHTKLKEGLVGTLFGSKVVVDTTLTDYRIRLFNEDKNILAHCTFSETFFYIITESTGEKHAIVACNDNEAIAKTGPNMNKKSFINIEKICSFNQIKQ